MLILWSLYPCEHISSDFPSLLRVILREAEEIQLWIYKVMGSKAKCKNAKYEKLRSDDSDNENFELRGKESSHCYEPDEEAYLTAKHPTSYFETLVNFFKGIVGAGIFSLPASFSLVGYAGGSIGLIILTIVSYYCEYILVKTNYELSRRRRIPCMNFQQTAEAAFQDGPRKLRWASKPARISVKVMIHILVFGSACVYNLIIAVNSKKIFDPVFGPRHLRWYMLYMLIFLIPVNLIKNLKFIAPLSAACNILMLVSIFCVFSYVMKDLPPLTDRRAFGDIRLVPQFAGTVFFANSCITLILPLRNEMKNRRDFIKTPFGVLIVGTVLIFCVYWLFALFGYLKYGDDVYDSITLNLPPGAVGSVIIQTSVALATLFTTPLNSYVLYELLLMDLVKSDNEKTLERADIIIRTITVILSVIVTYLVPNLNLLVSLLGVGANAYLVLFLPAVMHLVTFRHIMSKSQIAFNYTLMIFACFLCFTGTYENVSAIIHLYMNP